MCTSDLQLRFLFITRSIFPTEIALDFIIHRIYVVFTGSSAKYCILTYPKNYYNEEVVSHLSPVTVVRAAHGRAQTERNVCNEDGEW